MSRGTTPPSTPPTTLQHVHPTQFSKVNLKSKSILQEGEACLELLESKGNEAVMRGAEEHSRGERPPFRILLQHLQSLYKHLQLLYSIIRCIKVRGRTPTLVLIQVCLCTLTRRLTFAFTRSGNKDCLSPQSNGTV